MTAREYLNTELMGGRVASSSIILPFQKAKALASNTIDIAKEMGYKTVIYHNPGDKSATLEYTKEV